MLLTITTTYKPALDLGYILHKNPFRCQSFKLPFGKALVFYPEAASDRCTVALLLDIDPIELVRGKRRRDSSMPLEQYVNDKPYTCSSFMSVAISRVFGQALNGKCKEKPELVQTTMPLKCKLSVLPCKGGERFLRGLLEPLGYSVTATRHPLDDCFPDWGDSLYYTVEISKDATVVELLNHLYVLIPVLDNQKHYYIGKAEIDKLLKRGEGWLADHPEKENITKRYLKYRTNYAREALARLMELNPADPEEGESLEDLSEKDIEGAINLNEQRLGTILSVLKAANAKSILDLGCGEGKLLKQLLKDRQFKKIVGMDVSIRALEIAADRLRLEDLPPALRQRVELMHGSLMYRDRRLEGFDAAAVVEVVEHLDVPRLRAFERVLFQFARPKTIALTTPNREYNIKWENIGAERLDIKTTGSNGPGKNSKPGQRRSLKNTAIKSAFYQLETSMQLWAHRRKCAFSLKKAKHKV
ncbi:MAG: 3' terminal RNA ribose 2'-O-methyltransferase Hen1 [Desulfobacterales bacterium]